MQDSSTQDICIIDKTVIHEAVQKGHKHEIEAVVATLAKHIGVGNIDGWANHKKICLALQEILFLSPIKYETVESADRYLPLLAKVSEAMHTNDLSSARQMNALMILSALEKVHSAVWTMGTNGEAKFALNEVSGASLRAGLTTLPLLSKIGLNSFFLRAATQIIKRQKSITVQDILIELSVLKDKIALNARFLNDLESYQEQIEPMMEIDKDAYNKEISDITSKKEKMIEGLCKTLANLITLKYTVLSACHHASERRLVEDLFSIDRYITPATHNKFELEELAKNVCEIMSSPFANQFEAYNNCIPIEDIYLMKAIYVKDYVAIFMHTAASAVTCAAFCTDDNFDLAIPVNRNKIVPLPGYSKLLFGIPFAASSIIQALKIYIKHSMFARKTDRSILEYKEKSIKYMAEIISLIVNTKQIVKRLASKASIFEDEKSKYTEGLTSQTGGNGGAGYIKQGEQVLELFNNYMDQKAKLYAAIKGYLEYKNISRNLILHSAEKLDD